MPLGLDAEVHSTASQTWPEADPEPATVKKAGGDLNSLRIDRTHMAVLELRDRSGTLVH